MDQMESIHRHLIHLFTRQWQDKQSCGDRLARQNYGNSNNNINTTGGGPAGSYLHNQTAWERVADYPLDDVTSYGYAGKGGFSSLGSRNLASSNMFF